MIRAISRPPLSSAQQVVAPQIPCLPLCFGSKKLQQSYREFAARYVFRSEVLVVPALFYSANLVALSLAKVSVAAESPPLSARTRTGIQGELCQGGQQYAYSDQSTHSCACAHL